MLIIYQCSVPAFNGCLTILQQNCMLYALPPAHSLSLTSQLGRSKGGFMAGVTHTVTISPKLFNVSLYTAGSDHSGMGVLNRACWTLQLSEAHLEQEWRANEFPM